MLKAIAFMLSLLTGLIILFAGAFVVPSADSTDLNQGLVAYWNFDEGSGSVLHDYSGNGNNGTIYEATWTTGISGGALSFDGVNDYVDIPDADILSFGDGSNDYPFTFAAWIKRSSSGQDHVILSKYNSYVSPRRQEYIFSVGANDALWASIWDTPTSNYDKCIYTTATVNTSWHFVTATYEGSGLVEGLKLYIDGVEQQTSIENDNPNYIAMHNTTETFKIGRYTENYGDWDCFNGLIDEVRIYDRALSEAEIKLLFCSSYIHRGDVNGDGVINVSDVVYLINYLFINGPVPPPLQAGDTNCDGTVK
jgi:hypothetical protein